MAGNQTRPLQLGILGAANIARQFVSAVAPSKLITVAAVASRDLAKAESFARELGIPKAHGSYEALLADPAIDAIYNPLPNSLHAEWSIKAAQAKKHVLSEKPLTTSGAEARAIFEAASKHSVHIVEAYPFRAQAQTLKVQELIQSGAIGKVQLIRASFGFTMKDTGNIRLQPKLGGGSIFDAGSYAVSFVTMIAKSRPTRVFASARWSPTGADETMVATLDFANGILAQVSSSFGTGYHRLASVTGDKGMIETTFLNHPPIAGLPEVIISRGPMAAVPRETLEVQGGNGFLLEAESFQRLVTKGVGEWTGARPQESIDIALTIDAILESARSGKPVTPQG